MSHKRHYEVVIDDEVHDVYCDTLPAGIFDGVEIAPRITFKPLLHGPNYDGSLNSIRAALIYEPVRPAVLWKVWRYLYDRNREWVPAEELREIGGGAALERVRDLRKFGWPIETMPPPDHVGMWLYRMALPRRRRVNGHGP